MGKANLVKWSVAAIGLLAIGTVSFAQQGDAAAKPETIKIEADTYYGVRAIAGYNLIGTYLYESKGEPRVELNADGSGCFATHGRPCRPLSWWVMAEENGEPKTQKDEIGQRHTLIFRFADNGSYDMNSLTIRYDMRKIFILGEREKDF